MSVLTPERVPVKIYKWNDLGAPNLSRAANSVSEIFKACLVTGYGTKDSAGWTMPYEDAAIGVKVFRPEVGVESDFYLRLSADTGKEVAAQVYLGMTDVNTGELKLQCRTPFKYAKGSISGKWLLVASTRGVWFLCEQNVASSVSKTGCHFFAGDLAKNNIGQKVVYLHHTGGDDGNISFSTITGYRASGFTKGGGYNVEGRVLLADGSVVDAFPASLPNGLDAMSNDDTVMPVFVIAGGKVHIMPAAYIPFSGASNSNFDEVQVLGDGGAFSSVVFGTAVRDNSNLYIASDGWVY